MSLADLLKRDPEVEADIGRILDTSTSIRVFHLSEKGVDIRDIATPTFNVVGKKYEEGERKNNIYIAKGSGVGLSRLSASHRQLIPTDAPFVDGRRYRDAGACEIGSRLDVFIEDASGPWVRRHGVLIAVNPRAFP